MHIRGWSGSPSPKAKGSQFLSLASHYHVRQTHKNGKTTIVPLTERALGAIDSIPILPGCPYIFYNATTGARWYDARKPWLKARQAAGYPWLLVRDLRPAFGIQTSEMEVPMHFIQSVLRHGSVAVTEKYYANFSPQSAVKMVLATMESGCRG